MGALKSLNHYFIKYKNQWLLGILFIFFSNWLSIYPTEYIRKAINIIAEAVTKPTKFKGQTLINLEDDLLIYGLLIVGLPIISGILRFFMRQTIIVTSRKIEFDMKNVIYNHYQSLPLTFYKKKQIGDLMNRISEDVSNVRMYLGPGIMYIINLIIMFFIILYYMLKVNWILTLCALSPLPFLSFLIYKVSKIINKKSKEVQQNQSNISSYVQDSFSGIRVIKAYHKEQYISNDYNKKVHKYREVYLSLAKTESLFFPLMILIIGLSYMLILYVGGVLYIDNKIDIGGIASFFIYLNFLIWPFTSLGWVTSMNQRAEASMQRINEFLNEKPENLNNEKVTTSFKGKVEFIDVSYTYPNTGIKALDKVSFKLESGNSMAILGKTGSGKTTIGLLLTGLIQADEGEILIDDISINDINIESLRNQIGYVPQEAFLFSETIEENISFGENNSDFRKVKKFSEKAQIDENISQFKEGYSTKVGERGVTLSGGQKQRIAIARALIINPNFLIFDDSLSAIDTETEEKILKELEKESKNKTTFIITHRVSSAKNTDKIIVLEKGKIIQTGTHKSLSENEGFYKSLIEKQM